MVKLPSKIDLRCFGLETRAVSSNGLKRVELDSWPYKTGFKFHQMPWGLPNTGISHKILPSGND